MNYKNSCNSPKFIKMSAFRKENKGDKKFSVLIRNARAKDDIVCLSEEEVGCAATYRELGEFFPYSREF